jgi:hypothetical protein
MTKRRLMTRTDRPQRISADEPAGGGKLYPKMTHRVEIITPEVAASYLATNKDNRPIRPILVRVLAADMTGGRWMLTHQGIAFDTTGRLHDGQHRLIARIKAGEKTKGPIRMLVTRGCDPATFRVVDQGNLRSAADLFVLLGGKCAINPRAIAGVAAPIIRGIRSGFGTTGRPSREAIAKYAYKHQDIIITVLGILNRDERTKGGEVAAAFAHAAILFGMDKVTPLMDRYADEQWLGKDDPIKVFQHLILQFKISGSKRGRGSRPTLRTVYALSVSAIRTALRDETCANGKLVPAMVDFAKDDLDKRKKFPNSARSIMPPSIPLRAKA